MKQPTSTQKRNPVNDGNRLNHALVRAVVLLSMFAIFAPRASAAIYTFDVPSAAPWYDTGIDISAGSELDITATGIVVYDTNNGFGYSSDANGGDWTGNNFLSDTVIPNTMIHSLIGKIGGTTDVGTGTPVPEGLPGYGVGFIGTSYSKEVSTSGRLFLGYNDEVIPGWFNDNSGLFSVTVSVIPEPATWSLLALGVLALLGTRRLRRSS
ncbi:MAG TPA: PEP-CTERM sorting domain-containing protein [Verrucomicrobiae bacterium]|nr:PEP-CTERM sorting domain-containing protein [Verrucomicrobiae bacterium]